MHGAFHLNPGFWQRIQIAQREVPLANRCYGSSIEPVQRALDLSCISLNFAWVLLLLMFMCPALTADTITFGGVITQSTRDGTGPALNNPSLNSVKDGDPYLLTLSFTGSITMAGNYNLTGFSLSFDDPSAGAAESAFSSVNLTLTQSGALYDVSMLACLTTGTTGCAASNQLALDFGIPLAGINSQNVTAQSLPLLTPFDLLEDDGTTDIHASVNKYSYTSAVPEPGSLLLLGSGLALAWIRKSIRSTPGCTIKPFRRLP